MFETSINNFRAAEQLAEQFYQSLSQRSGVSVGDLKVKYPLPKVVVDHSLATEEQQHFKAWAGTERPPMRITDALEDPDFKWGKEPVVFKAYHGTTHQFDKFKKSEEEYGFLGNRVTYTTSMNDDAQYNYGADGPDLTRNIENLSENISGDNAAAVTEVARAIRSGKAEQVLNLYVRTENPFVIGSDTFVPLEFEQTEEEIEKEKFSDLVDEENIPFEFTLEELKNEVRDEDFWDHDIDPDDLRMKLEDRCWEARYEQPNPVAEAIQRSFDKYSDGFGDLKKCEIILDFEQSCWENEGFRHSALWDFLDNYERLMVFENTDGLVGNSVKADIIFELGFDSIVLPDPSSRFERMDHCSGGAHIHIPTELHSNIKSVDNFGTFSRSDDSILKMIAPTGDAIDVTRGQIELAQADGEQTIITLASSDDEHALVHELAHHYYDILGRMAQDGHAFAQNDLNELENWMCEQPHMIQDVLDTYFGIQLTQTEICDYFLDEDNIPKDLEAVFHKAKHEVFVQGAEHYFLNEIPERQFALRDKVKAIFSSLKSVLSKGFHRINHFNIKMPDPVSKVYAHMLSGALESTNTHQAYEDVKHCLERLENAQSIEDIGDYETELADIYQELQEVACDYADYSTPSGHVMNIKNIEGRYDEVISIMFSKNNRRDDPEDGLSACIIIDEKEGVIKELSFQEGKICRHSLEHARGY